MLKIRKSIEKWILKGKWILIQFFKSFEISRWKSIQNIEKVIYITFLFQFRNTFIFHNLEWHIESSDKIIVISTLFLHILYTFGSVGHFNDQNICVMLYQKITVFYVGMSDYFWFQISMWFRINFFLSVRGYRWAQIFI